jgi:hypothetical protein
MKPSVLAIPLLCTATLAGCAAGQASQPSASMGSAPMAMMADKQMMDRCMAHMSQMSPEMMQQHMAMMRRHHQMMDQSIRPEKSS